MKYLIRVVWREDGEIHSSFKETQNYALALSIFGNYSKLMKLSPILEIERVSLYEDGYEIERMIIQYGNQIRN